MLTIKTYQDFAKFLQEKLDPPGIILGVGVTAFMRFFPALFLKNFKIITWKDSKDNKVLEKFTDIFCLKKIEPGVKLKFYNANNLLRVETVRNYILSFPGKKFLFLYRLNNNIQNAVRQWGAEFIVNKARINKIFENKASFRKVLNKIGVQPIFGETLEFLDFYPREYKDMAKLYGPKFVIQLPDFMLGGGKGTLFITKANDFNKFKSEIKEGIYKDKKLTVVNITEFISGLSCSVACCATQYGTLVSKIQRQIIDIPQIISAKKGNGLFCGHVFGPEFNSEIIKQAQGIATKLGNYMYELGYKGIFGLDLVVDEKNNKVYPVECNARYTGVFPMLSMIHLKNKIIPLDFFHFLEFLNIDYKVNVGELNKMYQQPISGSHIILSNTNDFSIEVENELKVGVYNFHNKTKKISWQNPEILYEVLKNDNQFVLVDGVPNKGDIIKKYSGLARICHVLFRGNILRANGQLKKKYREIVDSIYKALFK